jgi:predicted nucleotidyltransferase
MTELEILFDVTEKLGRAGIDYMLTGSMAMNYYAVPRMTRDIDIVIELNSRDVNRVVTIFDGDYYISDIGVREAIEYESAFNIIHNTEILKIDFIIKKNTEFRQTEFKRKKKVKIDGFEIYITSLEDLIISKLHWAKNSDSSMQITDVDNLLTGEYDKEYLEYWLRKLHINFEF